MTALFVFARVVLVLVAVVHSLPQKGGKTGGNQLGGNQPGGQNGGGQRVTGEAGSAVGSRGDFWHRL